MEQSEKIIKEAKEDKLIDLLNKIHDEINDIVKPTINQRMRLAIYLDNYELRGKDDKAILNELKSILIGTKPAKYDPYVKDARNRIWLKYCAQCEKLGIEPK